MSKLLITLFITSLISFTAQAQETQPDEAFKTKTFTEILNPKHSKVTFKISTTTYKAHVQLEFDAQKLDGGQYAVYKTPDCDKKNLTAGKLKKLDPKDQFFDFTTGSGNIFEERRLDLESATAFNITKHSLILVKVGKQNTAIACALK